MLIMILHKICTLFSFHDFATNINNNKFSQKPIYKTIKLNYSNFNEENKPI